MNDQDIFQELDARAAAAATDLRAAAGSRPRPAFDPERSPAIPVAPPTGAGRAVPRRTLAAVAAVAVLVAGGVIWAAARPDDDRPGPVTTTTDAPRPFVLGSLPDGFSLAGAGEATGSEPEGAEDSARPLAVYGPAPDQPRVGVAVLGDFDPDGLGLGTDPVEIGGVEAYVFDGKGFGPRAVLVDVAGTGVLALGPTLEHAQLVGLLDGARIVDGSVVVDDEVLPEGWSELGEEPSLVSLISPVAAARGSVGPGSYVGYQSGGLTAEDSAEVRTIFVSSVPGDEVRLHAPELAAGRTERVNVGGREAVGGSTTTEEVEGAAITTTFVTWLERPGELIRITAMGVPLEELVRIAETVEPIGTEAWDDLVERSLLGDFDTGEYRESGGELVEMARGRFDDGTAWVLRVWPADGEEPTGPNASIDLQVALGGDSTSGASSGSSSGSGTEIGADGEPVEAALGSSSTVEQGGRTFGAGFVGADVDTVVLVGTGGAELGRAEIVSGLGRRAWVAEAVDGVVEVVARSADGTELGRQGFGVGSAPSQQSPTTVVTGGP